MTLWMLWATAVTALLGLAALLGERVLRIGGRQARGAWAAAIAGALALQIWSVLRPPIPSVPGADLSSTEALAGLQALFAEGIEAASVSAPALLERLDPYALVGWLVASAILMAGLLGGLWRLRRYAKHWAAGWVADLEVLVSEDFGPALVGVWSPRIVVPRWALSLTPESLRMACVHEAEHRAVRDTWLLFGGALLVALTPWNAALWWQVVRLRQAIELDCDRRVLNAGFSKSSYGALLLELGAHPRGVMASVAAFAQPPSLLERRLTMMMTDVKQAGPIRTAGALATVGLLAFAACQAPPPTAMPSSSDAEMTEVPETGSSEQTEVTAEVTTEVTPEVTYLLMSEWEDSLSLQGLLSERTPGLNFSRTNEADEPGAAINIRGFSDIEAGDQPLIYVGGIRVNGAAAGGVLDGIDPSDIESIEILKGPAAAVLYGTEASAGVIHITMKEPAGGS